jgi:hypothetical protein
MNTYRNTSIALLIVLIISIYFNGTLLTNNGKQSEKSTEQHTQQTEVPRAESIAPLCTEILDFEKTNSDAPLRTLRNNRYLILDQNVEGEDIQDPLYMPYSTFIDCFSTTPGYNYGIYNKNNQKFYYMGEIAHGKTVADEEEYQAHYSQALYGKIQLATIKLEKTNANKLVFILSSGDATDWTTSILDFNHIKQLPDTALLVLPYTDMAHDPKDPNFQTIDKYIDFFPGQYPAMLSTPQ